MKKRKELSLEKLKERYFDIMAMREFGMGLQRICKKYKISTPTMYKIIKNGEPDDSHLKRYLLHSPLLNRVDKKVIKLVKVLKVSEDFKRPRNIYNGLKQRCLNPKNKNYNLYGGRGITVCERWKESFANFWEDMKGTYKNNLTIDRIDNNKGYSKENCRWIPANHQQNNRRPFSEWNSKYNARKRC